MKLNTGLRAAAIALVGVLVLLLAAFPVSAQGFVELTPDLDARAARLYSSIQCPICDGQTISQSNAAIAVTMRQMVRERLIAGETDEEILAFMAESFGHDILSSPPTRGIGALVWVIPPSALLAGAVVVVLAIRRLKEQGATSLGVDHQRPTDLPDVYFDLIDQEMERQKQ